MSMTGFDLIGSHQGGVKNTQYNKHAEKTNLPLGAKNAMQNNMMQQYLYHGGHIQGHAHMTWTTDLIGQP